MSLVVWLPLNGNINNQGLSGATFNYVNNNGALSVNDSGKIGKCYERTASAKADTLRSSTTFTFGEDISMCCWGYVSGTIGDTANGLVTNHSHADNTGVGITVKQVSTSDYRISCNTGVGNDRTYCTYYGTTNIKNAWHHLCLTYSKIKKQLKLWVDGKVEYTLSNYVNASKPDYIDIFNWSTTYYTSGDFRPTCKLNDVRVYDHCLSPKEVKEIAKGLVCNYKLAGPGQTNLIKGNFSCTSTNKEYKSSGSVTCTLSASDILANKGKTLVLSYDVYSLGAATANTAGNWQASRFGIHGIINYTKTGASSATQDYPLANLLSCGKNGKVYTTWTIPTDIETVNSTLGFAIQTNGRDGYAYPASSNTSTWYIKNVKLEWGNTYTPWVPNPVDASYTSLGYADTTEYDCSGFCNNGIKKGTISWNGDTARYSSCYKLIGGNTGITTPNFAFELMPQGTVSLWINRHSTDSTWRNYLFFANDFNWTGNTMDFIIYGSTGTQAIVMDCCSNTFSFTPDLNKWYLYTLTWNFNTKTAKFYINGELKQTLINNRIGVEYAEKHNSHYVGANDSTVTNFSISDFRLYTTALSDTDIKELYNTPVSLTDTSSLLIQGEFKEV